VKRGIDCAVEMHWTPVPLEDHHIKPKENGGLKLWRGLPNIVRVCSNAHGNVHYFMDLLLKYEGKVPWKIARTFGKKTRSIAIMGVYRIMQDTAVADVPLLREQALRRLEEDARGN
jgi:hypothetical protein